MMHCDNVSGVGVKATAASAQLGTTGRACGKTAASVTGTSGRYATPTDFFGQPSFEERGEPDCV